MYLIKQGIENGMSVRVKKKINRGLESGKHSTGLFHWKVSSLLLNDLWTNMYKAQYDFPPCPSHGIFSEKIGGWVMSEGTRRVAVVQAQATCPAPRAALLETKERLHFQPAQSGLVFFSFKH